MTIPYVCGVLKSLKECEFQEVARANPLITMGLQEARKKLLQYYPVFSDDIEQIKDLHIATALDPRLKLGVPDDLGLSGSTICAIKAYFFKVFHHYKEEILAEENGGPKRRQSNEERRKSGQAAGKMSDLFYKEQDTAGDHEDKEIEEYLAQARSPRSLSILEFYGTHKTLIRQFIGWRRISYL